MFWMPVLHIRDDHPWTAFNKNPYLNLISSLFISKKNNIYEYLVLVKLKCLFKGRLNRKFAASERVQDDGKSLEGILW